ncbi:CaiB/BaiF CoA transferase family protein [Paraglaciecola sp. 2405UD69-4]|uniref:CaiB/BaiF CoA transferase family protein n=1 Tax=Paraglaciecola sp. 2405UD69-4 TaxID=3391836 RepID=UPI0039C95D21
MGTNQQAPLSGIQVVEFSHMVMGPSIGLILADLGADVIKVEPVTGDKTRNLKGSGAGYFAMYNRNKRSICLDMKSDEGKEVVNKLVAKADVVIENFRPGALEKLGYGYEVLKQTNPKLIYCSARGFLKGPYENRTALDEVAQMMGGLAYMTGPVGRPLRAGASVIDVMGGMFGVIGILAALEKRHSSGEGQNITSSLYESTVFLVGQHMAQKVVTGRPADPMPARISAWAIYDVFDVANGEKLFVGVVSDSQWKIFCEDFGFTEFAANRTMDTNSGRVDLRSEIIPIVAARFATLSVQELSSKLAKSGLPYAPITKPQDLFDDVHLNNSDGLINVGLPNGSHAKLPALPISMSDERFGLKRDVPSIGEHSKEILEQLGLTETQIEDLYKNGIAG